MPRPAMALASLSINGGVPDARRRAVWLSGGTTFAKSRCISYLGIDCLYRNSPLGHGMFQNSKMTAIAPHFRHVETWVFDLDNTLYPPQMRLFDQIEVRMTRFVMHALGVDRATADHLRNHYWTMYGTTLAGLMREHDLDPDPYLEDVHDINFDILLPDPDLAARLSDLPGRRIVYTNGCAPYAEKVIEARGLSGCFDAIYGVEHAGFHPKPDRAAFEAVFALDRVEPTRAAMFEDEPRNLAVPHEMGMRTVLVAPNCPGIDHVEFHAEDLTHFLSQL